MFATGNKVNQDLSLKSYKKLQTPYLLIPITGLLFGLMYISFIDKYKYVSALFLGVIFTFIIFKHSKLGIILILIFNYFITTWFTGHYFSFMRPFRFTASIVILLLLLKLLGSFLVRIKKPQRTPIDITVALFFGLGLASMIFNGTSLEIAFFSGFREAFMYIILFYVIVNLDFDEKFLQKVIRYLIYIALLQIPITLLQKFVFFPGRSDLHGGSLGFHGTAILALWLVGIISILIAFGIFDQKNFKPRLSIALLLIPLLVGHARAVGYFAPAAFMFLLGHGTTKKIGKYVLLGAFIFLLLGVVIFYVEPVYLTLFTNPQHYIERATTPAQGDSRQGRLQIIQYAHQVISRNYPLLIFGLGPGMGEQSGMEMLRQESFSEFNDYTATQMSRTLIEYGVFGLLFNFLIIFQIYKMNRKFLSKIDDLYWKSISLGFFGYIFVYAGATVYREIWYKPALAFFFWFLSAVIYRVGKNKQIL